MKVGVQGCECKRTCHSAQEAVAACDWCLCCFENAVLGRQDGGGCWLPVSARLGALHWAGQCAFASQQTFTYCDSLEL